MFSQSEAEQQPSSRIGCSPPCHLSAPASWFRVMDDGGGGGLWGCMGVSVINPHKGGDMWRGISWQGRVPRAPGRVVRQVQQPCHQTPGPCPPPHVVGSMRVVPHLNFSEKKTSPIAGLASASPPGVGGQQTRRQVPLQSKQERAQSRQAGCMACVGDTSLCATELNCVE